jgi:hypothetical protein
VRRGISISSGSLPLGDRPLALVLANPLSNCHVGHPVLPPHCEITELINLLDELFVWWAFHLPRGNASAPITLGFGFACDPSAFHTISSNTAGGDT